MSLTCPAGHQSESTDYCDTCGAPLDAAPAAGTPAGAGAGVASPASAAARGPGGGGATGGGVAGGGAGAGGGGGASGAGGGSSAGAASPGGGPAGAGSPQQCPHCGEENPADALFCEACGYDFTTGTLPRPVETPAAVGESPMASSGGSLDLDAVPPDSSAPTAPPVAASSSGSMAAQPLPGPSAAVSPPGTSATPSTAGDGGAARQSQWVVEVWVDPDWYAVQSSDEPCPSAGLPDVVRVHGTSLLVGRPSVSRGIRPDIDCSSDTGVSRRQAQLTTDGRRWFVEDLQSSNGTWVGPASGPLPDDPLPPGQRRELAEDDRIYVGAWTRLVVRKALPEEE